MYSQGICKFSNLKNTLLKTKHFCMSSQFFLLFHHYHAHAMERLLKTACESVKIFSKLIKYKHYFYPLVLPSFLVFLYFLLFFDKFIVVEWHVIKRKRMHACRLWCWRNRLYVFTYVVKIAASSLKHMICRVSSEQNCTALRFGFFLGPLSWCFATLYQKLF